MMNYRMMGRILSQILAVEALFMLPSLVLGFVDGNTKTAYSFAVSIGIILVLSAVLFSFCRNAEKIMHAKEGLVCVGLTWVMMSLLGCLPFVISGEIPKFIDAFFEIVSGFTTTGASVVGNVESLSRAVLYWRSFSHWLGGMGVLVFLLAIAPSAKQSGGFTLHLLRAESPGPSVGKLAPRMKQTAKILYLLYVVLTALDIIFLLIGGMPAFDSVCTAFGTAGTGGFGVKADSIAGYSPYIQNVCTVFMLLFGVNFSLFYLLLLRQFRSVFRSGELKAYLGVFAASVILIVINLGDYYGSFGETLRHSAFQVSSVMTTTGFATTDFNLWPTLSKSVMLVLMMIGACAGSTGGGLKFARLILLLKSLRRNIRTTLHPQRVQTIRSDDSPVDEKVLQNTNIYFVAYIIIIAVSFILVSFDGFSLTTGFSSVIACFNNIGPGFDAVGPAANYGGFSVISKLVLIMDMLAGRLEIFPILVLFSRSTWKKM